MRKVRFGFSVPKDHPFPIYSIIIKKMDDADFSHVYVRWKPRIIDEFICYEASGTQLKFIGQEVFDERIQPIYEYEIELEQEEFENGLAYCMKNSGKDYGFKQAFGMFLAKVLKLKKNPFADGRETQVCSEVAGAFLEKTGKSTGLDLDLATPKDIHNFVKNLGRAKRINLV